MNKDKIEEGDIAEFWFSGDHKITGTVLYTPQATDDCFHVRTDSGVLWYIQRFGCASLVKKATP